MESYKPKVITKYSNFIQERYIENKDSKIDFREYSLNSGIKRNTFSYKRVISSRNRNYNNKIEIYIEQ